MQYSTANGEAKADLMSIQGDERRQETLAMLTALSLSSTSFKEGKGRLAQDVFANLRTKAGQ